MIDIKAELRARLARKVEAPPPPAPRKPAKRKGGRRRDEASLCRDIILALAADPRVLVIRDKAGRVIFPHRNVQRRTPWGSFGLGVGSPDIVGVLVGVCSAGASVAGRFLGVEVKLPDDPAPDPPQVAWHAAARQAGALIIVARSVEEAIGCLP